VVGLFGFNYGELGGAFANDYALQPGRGYTNGQRRTLGAVLLPNDPLMAGVTAFDGGSSSYHSVTGLVPGAVAVANYDNGTPLVAKRTVAGFQTVNLNFHPGSSDTRSDFWVSSTGGTALIANALENVGAVAAVPEPATWAMMLVGFGMIGATARYRRRRTVSTRVSYAC